MQEKEQALLAGGAAQHHDAQADQIRYALDLEAAMSALEARLNEERICENAVSHVIQAIRDFYDADCVFVVATSLHSTMLRCIDKVYREGFVTSVLEGMLMLGTPALIQKMMQAKSVAVWDLHLLSEISPKAYQEMMSAGIESVHTVPFGVPGDGLLIVCNAKRHAFCSSFLRLASYVVAAELGAQSKPEKAAYPSGRQDAPSGHENEVYVKLLDGFELHTHAGVATEQTIGRKQGILFLVILLFQKGRLLPAQSLLHSLWNDPETLDDPERALRNLSYNVRKKIEPLFTENNFLEIHKSGYAISRRYTITTDFDRFVLRIREADELPDTASKLERYMEALDSFHGVVLPRNSAKVIARIVDQYERKRIDVQNVSLSLMFLLKQFDRMHDFIDHTSMYRGWDRELHYWDIKAKMGMQMFTEAREIFLEHKEKFSAFQIDEFGILA